MSNEIATYSMILSKLSLGKSGTECPTKTQILAINSLIVIENASTYGANECVKIDDIRKKVETWNYYLTVSPTSMSFGASGGTGSVTISSYKTVGSSTYAVDYSIDSSTLPSWASFNKSTSTFTIQSTTSTTGRTAKVYFDQDESGKRDYVELTQTGYTPPADNYVFTWEGGSTSDVSASFPWNFSANGTAANIPVISTKNGSSQSWSVSSKPSWITTSTTSSKVTISASDNSGSARSGEVVLTQSGSGKTLTVNVSQDAYVADTYVFTITPNTYDAPYSGASFIPRTVSTKNGSNIGYSLTSGGTDWVVVSTTGKITVEILKNTTSSTRSTTLVFTQNESGKTQSIEITQNGKQEVANRLTLTSLTYDTAYLFPPGEVPVEGSTVYLAFLVPNTFTWNTDNGLTINRGTIYAGNIASIYVRSGNRYTLVKSFQLQTGEQTVSF